MSRHPADEEAMSWARGACLACGAMIAVLLLAACGGVEARQAVPSLPPLTGGASAPVDVIVDDLTAGDPSGFAAREAAFAAVVRSAWKERAGLVFAALDARSGKLHIVFTTRAVPSAVNDTFGELQRSAMDKAMLTAFRRSDGERGARGPLIDPVAVLAELQAELRGLGAGRYRVLFMTTGQLQAPAGLADPELLRRRPAGAAAALAATGRLPDLRGWAVAIQVPGSISDERSLALRALWWAVLRRAGGQLSGFQQNVLTWPLAALPRPPAPVVTEGPAGSGELRVRVPDSLLFDVDQARIRSDARPVIAHLAALLLKRYPRASVTINGYTDSSGQRSWNLRLSRARAAAVARALRAAGVAASRLRVRGRGANCFTASNATAAGRQLNRRVEIVITTKARP